MFPFRLSFGTRSVGRSLSIRRSIEATRSAFFLVLLAQAPALAQEGATLSGHVLDATDGVPVGFATLVIEHAESGETLTGALTDEDGRFVVQGLEPAEYKVWASFPGLYPSFPNSVST